jgi:hypothetical protein
VLGFKSKSAPKRKPVGLFVVVQHVPGAEPETQAGKPWSHAEALRIFDGVLREAPTGFFAPHTGASLRVVPAADWERTTSALMES